MMITTKKQLQQQLKEDAPYFIVGGSVAYALQVFVDETKETLALQEVAGETTTDMTASRAQLRQAGLAPKMIALLFQHVGFTALWTLLTKYEMEKRLPDYSEILIKQTKNE